MDEPHTVHRVSLPGDEQDSVTWGWLWAVSSCNFNMPSSALRAQSLRTSVDPLASSESSSEAEDSAAGFDSDESDYLDSEKPRKKQRVSPVHKSAHEDEISEPEDEDDDHDADEDEDEEVTRIVSSINVPSRIKRKAEQAAPTDRTVKPSNAISVPTDADTTFDSLNVHPWLVQSLANMAIKRPTGIQKSTIPEILKGRDCIGGSRTGSGKTVSFAVPILQKWASDPSAIFAVVLTPTR